MEEKASILFKASCEENDSNMRLRKIIRACKLITDLLPNEFERNILSEETNLFHYMLMCLYFHKTSIDLIMVSLLQIYEENDKNETIWLNLEFIGAIYDGDNMKERQLLETLSLHRSVSTGKDKYEKSLNKELLGHVVTISKQEFNLEIQKRLIKLKNLALDHVHHLFDWFIHKEKPIEFMENKLTLFKIFLLNTENSQIMARVCKTLELIKSNYPAIIKSQHLFENQIAFILKKKSDLDVPKEAKLPFLQVKDAYRNVFETPSPLLPTKNLLNEYNLGLRKNSSAHAKRFNELPLSPKKLTIYEQKISVESEESDNEEKVELEEHEKERIEKERVENLIKNLENWLCIDEENLFINNIEIEQHMKRDESLQILISFIVEPLKYLIDSLWSKKYEELGLRKIEIDYRAYQLNAFNGKNHESRGSTFYYLRSFKAASVICIRKNIKFLLSSNDQTFTTIFKGLNSGLATSSKEVNLYHIALMLENYLLLEPNVSSEYIIKVNLLENLIMNCHNPKLSEILINLIDPYISRYNIFGESQVKLWEWCYENNFFFRVISLAQNEKFDKMLEEESETTEEILQNSKKYYSGEKTQMIMKEMVKKFGMFQGLIESKVTENQEVNLPIRNKTLDDEILENLLGKSTMKKNEFESIKVEEIQGNLPDIDNFKDFIESKNKRKFLGANTKTLNHTKDKEILSNSITILSFDTLNNSVISRSSNKNININSKKNNNSVLQNQNNISEDNSSNRSTLDMQMGFTVSKVKNIYPNRLCKELITALDKIVQKDEYKLQNLIEEEKIAMPATCLVFEILNSMIENEENDKTREFLNKRKCVGGASIVDMLFNNSSICLEKIFLNYVLKINILSKKREGNNSAYECGKIINIIFKCMTLPKSKLFPLVSGHKEQILKKLKNYFDYFNKVIIQMYAMKIEGFYTQKFEVVFPIGNTRMLLFETLYYLVKLTVNEKVSLINEINATIWHMLIVGFFSNRLNDIYLQIAFNILEIAIESGSEDTLVNIFFKSNLVGSLYNAYDEFSKNEVQNKANNVDSFLYYTKKLVRLISQLNKKNNFTNIKQYLKESMNWKKIEQKFLNLRRNLGHPNNPSNVTISVSIKTPINVSSKQKN